ncbi:MAG TPA: ATP-binding protein [Clostridia bacterium]|nr:ATP-binding protein [Clostridia bacterium]
MRKRNVIASIAAFLILILFVSLSFTLLTGRVRQEIPELLPGYADLSDFDFGKKLAYIPHTSFLYYKDELYTPEDFRLGHVKKEPIVLKNTEKRFDPGNYGTYRIVLALPGDGETYGLSSYSAMYSQRMFINGKEYAVFGSPGKTAESTIPKTGHYTVYFTPGRDETELIIQFSNFNHADFGGIVPVYVGSQEKITERDAVANQRIHIIAGCSLTVFLFFLGLFFFFRRRYAFLWFSLACLSIGLRALIVDEKVIMLLIPDLPWRISIGLEYLSLILLLFSFLLYTHNMFRGALYKAVLAVFGILCAAYAVTVLLTPPRSYTGFILWFQFGSVLFGIYVTAALVYNVVRKKDNRHIEHVLILIGGFVFILLSAMDVQIHRSGGFSLALGLSQVGMIVLIFTNMIALALQFSRTEAELDKARRSELEMKETNQLLDRMSRLKSDFLANVSHEMRTPLTVMASYAGLTSMQLRRNAIDDKTLDNLETVKREAIRLAGLVEQLKEVAMEKERQNTLTEVEAATLLKQAADFCEPICRKNKNRISVCGENMKFFLHVNEESIFQTLVNLIINANRHTKKGTICLNAEQYGTDLHGNFVKLTVSDNGDGIAPELLPRLFQRGVSGDGSSGLGLVICKEIVEEHGGEIWIESEWGKGTIICFTLPCGKESVADEKSCSTDY